MVRAKTSVLHISLHGHNSGTLSAIELFKCSKDLASLVLCNEKGKFYVFGFGFFVSDIISWEDF